MSKDQYIGFKLKIYPDITQKNRLIEYFGVSRYIYNLVLYLEEQEYKKSGKFLTEYMLYDKIAYIKSKKEWLADISVDTIRIAISDAINAYLRFFKKISSYPKRKKKKNPEQKCGFRSDRVTIEEGFIRIPSIGRVRCSTITNIGIMGKGAFRKTDPDSYRKYYNTRVYFDGVDYWFTISLKRSNDIYSNSEKNHIRLKSWVQIKPTESVGIDLGCKDSNWIVDSRNVRVTMPNVYNEDKKIRLLSRKLSRQQKVAKAKQQSVASNNYNKTLQRLNKYYTKIHNKFIDKIYRYSSDLLDSKPSRVVLESITSNSLMCRDRSKPSWLKRRLNKMVNRSMINTVKHIISYKCECNEIPIIFADSHYPSTKKCSVCGNIIEIGNSRTYKCPVCGNIIDRDLNSAINLAKY